MVSPPISGTPGPAVVLSASTNDTYVVIPLFARRSVPDLVELQVEPVDSGLLVPMIAQCTTITTVPGGSFKTLEGRICENAFLRLKSSVRKVFELDFLGGAYTSFVGQVWQVNIAVDTGDRKLRPAVILAPAADSSFIIVPVHKKRTNHPNSLQVEIGVEESGFPHTLFAECSTVGTLPSNCFEKSLFNLGSDSFRKIKELTMQGLGI